MCATNFSTPGATIHCANKSKRIDCKKYYTCLTLTTPAVHTVVEALESNIDFQLSSFKPCVRLHQQNSVQVHVRPK